MADFWQWKGDPVTGAGYVVFTATITATTVITSNVTVNISGTSTVNVSGTISVGFTGSQTVNISGTSTVNISGTSTVAFSGSQTVNVSGITTIAFVNSAGNTANIIDNDYDAVRVISDDHSFIHRGVFYATTVTANLTSAGSYNISIITSALETHMRPAKVSTSGDKMLIELYEDNSIQVSAGATGTTMTSYNHDRNAITLTKVTVITSGAITAAGTRISASYIGGGTGQGGNRSGAEQGADNEWILKSNSNYNVKLVNGSSSDNYALVKLTWYEI